MKHRNGGFTLIEIIVSLALIAIIAVGIIPAFAAQLKMTIDTKQLTVKSFEAQTEVEQLIQDLKGALIIDPVNITPFTGVSEATYTDIFTSGNSVTMYKLVQTFPSNTSKDFIVFLSKKLAAMEVRQLLVADGVTIQVSGETIHKVADLKKTPKPTLVGKFDTNTDPNWYTNLFKWYVSKEGDPSPVFPDDFERIIFAGVTPSTLTDLTKLANRYIVFTVTPVDIHGVRGNEAPSNNTIYVLGEEWRSGIFAWVDKDANVSFAEGTDVKVEKSLNWPLTRVFNFNDEFLDPSNPVVTMLDPSDGSLYVPMGIDRVAPALVGPIEIAGSNALNWTVDKSINLATDINVSNNSDIYMKTMDGNIVLYQYIELDALSGDAVFDAYGMPNMIDFGPDLRAPYGDILFETGGRGDVTLQNFSKLTAGDNITLRPFGHVSVYKGTLTAGGSILLDSTLGTTYPGDRDIIIQESQLALTANSVPNRLVTVDSLNSLTVSDTDFIGNSSASSAVSLAGVDGITLTNVDFFNSSIQMENDAAMIGGSWDAHSTITIKEGREIQFGASGTKVLNSGALVAGSTGTISFVSTMSNAMTNPLAITLGQGTYEDEVIISTNYGRNVAYADSNSLEGAAIGSYQNLGSGSTNLEYMVEKNSGYGTTSLYVAYDGDNKVTIDADGTGPISSIYTLSVADKYAEGIVGTIVFRVTAGEGESPTVRVIGSAIPTFTVSFNKNGGTVDAAPAVMTVNEGEALGTLPEPPVFAGHNFTGWNTAADGTGTAFNAATIVTDNITVYAQYTIIPIYTVTFDKNGGTTEASPTTMSVESGGLIGTLPEPPSKTGFWFQNWSTLPSGGSLVNEETQIWDNLTAYAQWTLKKRFSDINNGEYVSISGVSFQKISPDQLLTRNMISSGTEMRWGTANTLATSYYTGFNTDNTWVISSGLVSGTTLNNLGPYRTTILRDGYYEWWGAIRSGSQAYWVNRYGRVRDNALTTETYSCRPYIQVNATGLYVVYGNGTSASPYVLALE